MSTQQLVWHYTTLMHFRRIKADGFLRPATAGVGGNEKPVLWFSANPVWEETANKMVADWKGNVRFGDKEDTRRLGGGLVRIGIEKRKLHPWPEIARKARMPKIIQVSLEEVSLDQGANPAEWYGTTRTIPLDDVVSIEVETADGWVPIGADGWVPIGNADNVVPLRPKGEVQK